MTPFAAPTVMLIQTAGPEAQDPGWGAAAPAVIFLVMAAIVWWIWRRLADSD